MIVLKILIKFTKISNLDSKGFNRTIKTSKKIAKKQEKPIQENYYEQAYHRYESQQQPFGSNPNSHSGNSYTNYNNYQQHTTTSTSNETFQSMHYTHIFIINFISLINI